MRLVFLVQSVTQPVKRLNCPLLAHVLGEVCDAELLGGGAGDAERGDRREQVAVQVGDLPLDQDTCPACGNGRSSGAGRTWMVRVVIRPWPRSVAVCATGTSRQGSASSASNRAWRFSLIGKTNSPSAW